MNSSPITGLTPYVYGTTRLGDAKIPFDERVAMAREAMNSGVWFHTSTQYDDALDVLKVAFDQDRTRVPKLFYKIHGSNMDEFVKSIHEHIDVLGLDHVDVAQLCIGGELDQEFAEGGACYEAFRSLKEEGLVKHYVREVFPWTSEVPYRALKAGYTDGLVDAFIFYLNPLQRFADNRLWNLIQEKGAKVVAMRTVGGGDVSRLAHVPGAAWQPYLKDRAMEVEPIFKRSGVSSWCEFCVRFAHSFTNVLATVGSSGRSEHFQEFIKASCEKISPLPQDIVDEIVALQHRWSDELDVTVEPWSM